MEIDDRQSFILPEWTEYQKKNGLDPLGMQNSSVSLYQTFLPGISNVTLRMRYYGLYAWLCRTYALTDGSEDPTRWKTFIRRAEALYALVAYDAENQSGVAGIQWAERAFAEATTDTIDFAAAADPDSEAKYLKQPWGAYGAAYGSQLFAIGIFWERPGHALPVPSATFGDRLAKIFDETHGERAKLFADLIKRGSATKDEISQLTPIVPSEIPPKGAERELYQELLLSPPDAEDRDAQSRRLSLLLVLKIAELLKREPTIDEVRWVLYAGQDQEGSALTLNGEDLKKQRERWWVYQANVLCHFAYETLLKFTLDTLGSYPRGLTLESLVARCVERVTEVNAASASTWEGLVQAMHLPANGYAPEDESSEWHLSRSISSRVGRNAESDCPPESAWSAVQLLATLHKRVQEEEHPVEQELSGRSEADGFQTLLTESRFWEAHGHLPVGDLLAKLIEHKIVRRHLWIAARKFQSGDYTFLIEADDGRLRLREKDGPIFTNPRLGPAITFLKDIHLMSGQGLTDYGVEAISAV